MHVRLVSMGKLIKRQNLLSVNRMAEENNVKFYVKWTNLELIFWLGDRISEDYCLFVVKNSPREGGVNSAMKS